MLVDFFYIGVEKPRIDHVEFTATNRLMVLWSSNNTEIRHARVVIERGDVSIPSSCLDLTKKKAVFDIVDDTAPYNIKVTEYNKCDQELSSTCSVNPKMSQSAFSPTMFQCPSPPSGAPRLQSTSVLPTTYQFTSSASSIGVNLSPSPSSSSSIGVNLSPSPSSSSSIGVNLSPSPSSSSSGLSQFQGDGPIYISHRFCVAYFMQLENVVKAKVYYMYIHKRDRIERKQQSTVVL